MKKILSLITAAVTLLNSIIFCFFGTQTPVTQTFPATAVVGPVTTYQTGGGFTELHGNPDRQPQS